MENPWIQQLIQLKNGEIKELVVTLEDFAYFREAWLTFPDKMDFRGVASLGGKVTYLYDPDANPSKKNKE